MTSRSNRLLGPDTRPCVQKRVIVTPAIVKQCVKQGGVISPLLFSCYIGKHSSQLQHSSLGCHVGTSYAGALCYAESIALVQSLILKKDDYYM